MLYGVIALVAAAAILWAALAAVLFYKDKGNGREWRTEYARPDYGDAAGFRLTAWPDDALYRPYRYWLIEDTIAEVDYLVAPGQFLTLRAAKSGQLRAPQGYAAAQYERESRYELDGITVTQRQSAGRRTTAAWARDGFEFMICADEPEMNMVAGAAYTFVSTVRAELT